MNKRAYRIMIASIIITTFFTVAAVGTVAANDYSEIYIWPPNAGVLAGQRATPTSEDGTQQFEAWGVPVDGGQHVNITNKVDWYLQANPLLGMKAGDQKMEPDEVAKIDKTGLFTALSSWGRVDVSCCYPKGCASRPVLLVAPLKILLEQ